MLPLANDIVKKAKRDYEQKLEPVIELIKQFSERRIIGLWTKLRLPTIC